LEYVYLVAGVIGLTIGVVGSNIVTAQGILGGNVVIAPIMVAGRFRRFDFPGMFAALVPLTALLLTFAGNGRWVSMASWGAQG